ncbi:LOW QUALITY PROTEIN: hypothetical protein QTO34_019866 [Cnephaeus nilssonii]|uniref:DDE-1 domain-containing protein n=1 Tax=Cnephaeus nilssonii TaxID=3371016 RepID=A0AA40HXI3_CNENI|nr:LOW QUALITY PROTEIN: hypothetical protein QTO34_019866 [Eptesicus nilssonii]
MICEKVKILHSDLLKDTLEQELKVICLQLYSEAGQAVSSNEVAADNIKTEFQEHIEASRFVPQHRFGYDETGLFGKKMPKRTYITQKKSLPLKDRLTLLFCGNVSGDSKLKPLFIYHSENPQVFKKNNRMES